MTKFLYQEGEDFFWMGDLNDLKQFVETSLNLHGKWFSPGGDVKQFTGEEFVLKWQGVTKRKIVLVKDSEENALKSMLQNFVCENLNSEDDDFKGNMVSQTCLFDEILLAENSQMPLGDKTANLNVEPELENLNSEDDDFEGNMVSQTCLFDEILFAENSEMPLGDKTANLNVEPELEETLENKYCELKQEICKLKNVLNHEILQSRELENGLAEDVFKLKESINHELLLPREYIHHVNEEIAFLRTENARLKEQEINLTYIMSGLNTKLKTVEEEKKNLIAAVKILQENELEGNTNTCKTWNNVCRNSQHKPRPSEPSVMLMQNSDNDVITTNSFSNLVDEASQDCIQHSLYDRRSEKVCESRHSPGVNVQHCNTGEKSQRQMEINQRTRDEGETTKPAENESTIDLEKTIDVDEASHDSTQNSQQENGSVIIQDEIIEGRQNAAGNYSKKNKETNSHKEVQQQNTQRSLKPIVIIGDSIIKHINPKKLSRRPVRKFTYPGKTCEEIAECIDSIIVNDDPSQVIIHCGTNNLTTDQAEVCVDKIKNLVGKVKTKFPNSSIGVSSLTYREDINVDLIRVKVNDQLKRLAHDNNFQFSPRLFHVISSNPNV